MQIPHMKGRRDQPHQLPNSEFDLTETRVALTWATESEYRKISKRLPDGHTKTGLSFSEVVSRVQTQLPGLHVGWIWGNLG